MLASYPGFRWAGSLGMNATYTITSFLDHSQFLASFSDSLHSLGTRLCSLRTRLCSLEELGYAV